MVVTEKKFHTQASSLVSENPVTFWRILPSPKSHCHHCCNDDQVTLNVTMQKYSFPSNTPATAEQDSVHLYSGHNLEVVRNAVDF